MQSRGDSPQECEDFFVMCVNQLRHFRKIQESTSINWKNWIHNISVKMQQGIEEGTLDPKTYLCIEILGNPEAFQETLMNLPTSARGQQGGLSVTTISNYMQMFTYIMKNIELCTDDNDILRHSVFSNKNIKKWTQHFGSLNVDATNLRHKEYTNKIISAKCDWGQLIQRCKQNYIEHPNDLFYVNSYLLVLCYDCLCCRNDYGICRIYRRGDVIPLTLRKSTNYIDLNTLTIHVNDTKNKFEIGYNLYPTLQYITEELMNVLARSLRLCPRNYLFTSGDRLDSPVNDSNFGDYIKDHLGELYHYTNEYNQEKQLITGCDMIRHLFAQHYYRQMKILEGTGNPDEHRKAIRVFVNSISKMLHSQTTHMNNYISPYLLEGGKHIKVLDNITRQIPLTEDSLFMMMDKDDKERDKLIYDRFIQRLDTYHEDYTDVFGPELLGKEPGSSTIFISSLNGLNEFKEKVQQYYDDLKNNKYPNLIDLNNDVPKESEGLDIENITLQHKQYYEKYISKCHELTNQYDINRRYKVRTTRETFAASAINQWECRHEPLVPDKRPHRNEHPGYLNENDNNENIGSGICVPRTHLFTRSIGLGLFRTKIPHKKNNFFNCKFYC
ncbi:hypothetical protein WA158_003468 [Blastocystis sp. Blastoise]